VYRTVGRALDDEADTMALIAGVAEQVKPLYHEVIECNLQVLTGWQLGLKYVISEAPAFLKYKDQPYCYDRNERSANQPHGPHLPRP
jgi:hypothetical protein